MSRFGSVFRYIAKSAFISSHGDRSSGSSGDDRPGDAEPLTRPMRLGHRLDDDVGAVAERPEQRRRRHRLSTISGRPWRGRARPPRARSKNAGRGWTAARRRGSGCSRRSSTPTRRGWSSRPPSGTRPRARRLAHGELLEGAAVDLAGGDEVERLVRLRAVDREERVGGAGDGGHPRGGRAAGRLAVQPVPLQQREHLLEVVDRRGWRSASSTRSGSGSRQRRLHLVGVAVGLRRRQVDRLDEAPRSSALLPRCTAPCTAIVSNFSARTRARYFLTSRAQLVRLLDVPTDSRGKLLLHGLLRFLVRLGGVHKRQGDRGSLPVRRTARDL